MSCDNLNAYWNNATNPPDQSIVTAPLLPALRVYTICGGVASVFNIICIFTFVTKKELRQKYIFFTVLAFANLIITFYMFLGGIQRRKMIYNNQIMQLRSSFECLLQLGPHLLLPGYQLPAVVLLLIDIERLIAVYKPIFYKIHFKNRTRLFIVFGCFGVVFVSQLVGYLSSYLNRDICVSGFCTTNSVFGQSYSNYNSAIVILLPLFAFILSIVTYIGAKRIGKHTNIKKELRLILISIIITFIDVLLIACPNIVLSGTNNKLNFLTVSSANIMYLMVLFCCNSATNLFVYACLKRDFRNHLLMLISFGTLRACLKETNEIAEHQFTRNQRVAPKI